MDNELDIYWMQRALQLAELAASKDEVPIGAVLVLDNQIIGEGWNQPIATNDPTAHAEIIALRQGAQKINNYRLINTTLYVTLEPCNMCIGAMIHARIKRLVFGAYDSKNGKSSSPDSITSSRGLTAGSRFPAFSGNDGGEHQINYTGGILQQECSDLLTEFFKQRR